MGKLIKLTNSLLVPPQFCHQGWPFLRTPLAKCHWYGVISKHISIMEIPWIAQNHPNDVSINKDPIKMKKDQILYCIAMKRRPWVNYLAILRDATHLQNGWIFWKIPKGGHFQSKKLYCKIWIFKQGYLTMKLIQRGLFRLCLKNTENHYIIDALA